jgi:signal peptidase I
MSVTPAATHRVPARSFDESPVAEVLRRAVFLVICVLGLSLFVRSFVVQLFEVPSESMEPALMIGDTMVVTRSLTQWGEPRRGDIVVFRDPGGWLPRAPRSDSVLAEGLSFIGMIPYHSGEHVVKRVVGEAGDVVECRGRGPVFVNGVPAREPYVARGSYPCRENFKITVPARSVWVLGDNRDDSADSRFHLEDARHGSVPLSSVVGTVLVKVWPPTRWGLPASGSVR